MLILTAPELQIRENGESAISNLIIGEDKTLAACAFHVQRLMAHIAMTSNNFLSIAVFVCWFDIS